MKIAILDDYKDSIRALPAFDKMAGHEVVVFHDHTTDVDVLAQRLLDVDVLALIRERTPITAALLERLPRLKLVTQVGVYPHIDVAACTQRGVLVSSRTGPGHPNHATAELTWGLVLSAMRRIPQEVQSLQAGRWQAPGLGAELRGRTLGILGYGRIGSLVAGYGRAFGMPVLTWGREGSRARAQADGHDVAGSAEELFERSDVLSVHVGLVDATRGLVTAALLARMKPDALFVNTSRAGLVEEGALPAALAAGRPGMAALDVFEHEPLTGTVPDWLRQPNVVATPHVGYVARTSLQAMFSTIFDQILAFADGKPVNVVNPEVLAPAP